MTDLFDPCEFNGLKLKNRIALSPLTRTRSNDAGEAGELQALYYAQRASAGLLISEATPVAPGGRGGPNIPGLWNDGQIAGWRQVTDAVHAKDGVIFCQLWHAGRLSHSSLGGGEPPIAPSAMTQPGQVFGPNGLVPYEEARALRTDELPGIVEMFRAAAVRAKAAGFDGVELHGAHSYLIDAFLRDMTNKRTDAYGGSIENRARLLVETLQAIIGVWGPERTAVRLSPIGHAYEAWDSNPEPLFTYVVERLNDLKVGWLDMVEGDTGNSRTIEPSFDLQKLRRLFKGCLIANNLYDRDLAIAVRAADAADMIAFGRPFIGNPDLVERLRRNAPLNVADPRAYYGGGARGYTDFPTLEEAGVAG
ncbi:alkene reductase [uncultured Phenylobacterium sp.]|uniref:alkene reductase n=1 Tax=uncultured Phenylobacterium sp. TaxID=349273 RepID=UPI0025D53BB9|nr:alkene reductase [uncultured Phenylobacterium sp.]